MSNNSEFSLHSLEVICESAQGCDDKTVIRVGLDSANRSVTPVKKYVATAKERRLLHCDDMRGGLELDVIRPRRNRFAQQTPWISL